MFKQNDIMLKVYAWKLNVTIIVNIIKLTEINYSKIYIFWKYIIFIIVLFKNVLLLYDRKIILVHYQCYNHKLSI